MDKRLRRTPDAEWVLMYLLGPSRKRITELVRVHPAVVGDHLVIARGQERQAAAAVAPGLFPTGRARMEEVIA